VNRSKRSKKYRKKNKLNNIKISEYNWARKQNRFLMLKRSLRLRSPKRKKIKRRKWETRL